MIEKKTYTNALLDALPDVVKDAGLAERIVDIVFSVPIRALENGDKAVLPGLGTIAIDKGKGKDCLHYEPTKAAIECALKKKK
jgi:hypothetical protein